MSIKPTSTGWITTVVTPHKIKMARALSGTVQDWNNYNVKNPDAPSKRFRCPRCQTFWSSIPADQKVIICMMEKGVNQAICEACASEIDQSLIIK